VDSELVDDPVYAGLHVQEPVTSNQLSALLESLVPGLSAPESLALLAGTQTRPVTVNINPQIISALESTIVQNVHGVLYLDPRAKEILSLHNLKPRKMVLALRRPFPRCSGRSV
jgi:hypothetical protein